MELFRIAQKPYSTDLSGRGAFEYGGRWNEKEHYMLYTSGSRSLAMLETLVHLRRTQPPANRVVMILYLPDSLIVDTVHDRQLPEEWQT
ncbi:MAG: RES family NAD+ phosphorylase, partial [Bacteroidetes bacterium]|nr:RES family NAD+ phosphorylase [Fibrella sp.]